MNANVSRHMGFVLILLSGIFLSNPIVGFVDVLPDCIGYFLMCVGLMRLSDINGRLQESLRRFRVMLAVGVAQILAMYMIYGVMAERSAEMNPYERPVTVLLCSFVYAFFQFYYLIPAFRDLFAGLNRLAESHKAEALLAVRQSNRQARSHKNGGARSLNEKKNLCERLSRLTTVFILFSAVLSVLPELTILSSFETDVENPLFPFDWYAFIGMFRTVAMVICLIVSLVWVIRFILFFKTVLKEHEWLEQLRKRYITEVIPQTGMLTVRRFENVFLLLLIGMLFTFQLRVGDRSVLPGVIAALLFGGSFLLLGELLQDRKKHMIPCCLLAIASTVQLLLNQYYLSHFSVEDALYHTDAYWIFFAIRVLDVIEAIATLYAVATVLQVLSELVQCHTGVDYGDKGIVSQAATARLHREFYVKLCVSFGFFAFAALGKIADAFFRMTIPWLWYVPLVGTVVAICLFSSVLYDLRTEIKYFYQSDGTNNLH